MNAKRIAAVSLLIPIALVAVAFFLLFVLAFLFVGTANEAGEEVTESIQAISEFGENEIPPQYIPVYQAAAKKYSVPWNLLAAIHRVETNFSTAPKMESYAGAQGHMQFMPCTWAGWNHPSCGGLGRGAINTNEMINPAVIKRYGGFGVDGNGDGKADPFDIQDAVFTAANYLARNGAAEGKIREAVFAYNHSAKYVSDVTGYMEKFAKPAPEMDPKKIIMSTGGWARPTPARNNSGFGQRFHPILHIWRLHGGLDFDCATGDPIRASKPGVVSYAGWMDANNHKAGYGLYVWVEHGSGFKSGYNHLSALNVKVGDKVQAGQVVGACGTTGTSTGDHLHFEIFKNGVLVDPAPYLGL